MIVLNTFLPLCIFFLLILVLNFYNNAMDKAIPVITGMQHQLVIIFHNSVGWLSGIFDLSPHWLIWPRLAHITTVSW